MKARCKSCGAAITWARTEGGKAIPIDHASTPRGNLLLLPDLFGDPTAAVITAETFVPARCPRYQSHFATCPFAPEHRRPREARP